MLAHELIKKDIEIVYVDSGKVYDSNKIDFIVNALKHQIYQKLQGKTVGKIAFINTNDFLTVITSMRACWELGMALFLNDVDAKIKDLDYFKNFYKVIDISIVGKKSKFELTYSDVSLTDIDFSQDLEKFNLPLDKEISDETICYYAISSGTTGDPKILPHTHYQTVTISNFIKDYLKLNEASKPLHFKTLHHSSLFNSFALPLLNSCRTHYFSEQLITVKDTDSFAKKCYSIFDKLNITNFLIPYNWIKYFATQECDYNFNRNLTFCCIADCDYDKMQLLFEKFNIKQVVNYFGCSELGTMFLARTTHDNVKNYRAQHFYDVTPYIEYELHEERVLAKWKHQSEWTVLKDKITHTDDSIWYHHRSLLFERGDHSINLNELSNFLKDRLDVKDFVLVPDFKYQDLYLAILDSESSSVDIHTLNREIQQQFGTDFFIKDYRVFEYDQVLLGMKANSTLMLWVFRKGQ